MDHPVRTALLVLPLAVVTTGVATQSAYPSPPTNVILCIGDGMGFAQVDAASFYRNGVAGSLSFEAFPHQGQVTTYSADHAITDSAAAGTAIATGQKVNNGVISMAYPGDGSELETVLEYWQDRGKRTGLVTTTYMTHATPAAFGAHEPSRNNTTAIGIDYRTQTRPNVLLGGGANGMSPSSAAASGYTVVTNAAEMQSLDTDTESMVSGQFGTTHLPYEYDGLGSLPHLSDMTATALDILDNDPDGFFLMVEGGRIDHAGHANDIRRNIHETLEFSDTVQVALDWAAGRTDTTILVTADHETGGLTVLANNGAGFYPTVSWSSTDHTAVDVPIYAWGAGADLVSGVMDNTDLFEVMTIPEPATIGLLCLGGLAGLRRRALGSSGLTNRCPASTRSTVASAARTSETDLSTLGYVCPAGSSCAVDLSADCRMTFVNRSCFAPYSVCSVRRAASTSP